MWKCKIAEAAMGRAEEILLTALKMLEVGLSTYRGELIFSSDSFCERLELDGDESLDANEVDKDQEYTQLALLLRRAYKLGDGLERRPHKRRMLQEVAISKTIDHRARIRILRSVLTKLRSANVRARTKMKARRLLIDDNSSIKGFVTSSQVSKKAKEKEADAEIENSNRNPEPSGSHHCVHAFGEQEFRGIGGVIRHRGGTHFAGGVRGSCSGRSGENCHGAMAGFFASDVYGNHHEGEPRRSFDLRDSVGGRESTLQNRLEAFRVAFNDESRPVDELTADLMKRDQTHAAELAAKAKELAECEVARSLELEQMEKLKADCNEMRSLRSAAEEQLVVVEAKLLEVD
ncbi:hypothetical protein AXG93_167s1080 [Marchantia polymorpha subsp. ruderalis]|uniref:Uncharacterized protein n=1 Tax=Marchantia polymorpha subsp. ruderalis TaxID=1480154 RepID=A0A176WN99_MARPO|nr:hypothetical protein AXG93_167s1080 [Marchantia polymorpha subsp. ruderalis]